MADEVILEALPSVWPVPCSVFKCSGDLAHASRGTSSSIDKYTSWGGVKIEGIREESNGLVHLMDNVPASALAGLCAIGSKH